MAWGKIDDFTLRIIDLDQILPGNAGESGACTACYSDLAQCGIGKTAQIAPMWRHISTAPFDCDIELAVIDNDGPHALVFACRRILGGWMNAETRERLDVRPTHWREWQQEQPQRQIG